MHSESQDPIDAIEAAVIALRHFRPGGRGPREGRGGRGGPPWMQVHEHNGDATDRMPMVRGYRGPHDRTMGGAARFRLLAALRDRAGMSVSEIAETIGVDQPRASRLVNDSAERGLVTRRADDRDARRSVVELTDAGRATLTSANDSRRTAVTDAVSAFSADETAQFAALLTRFVAEWTRHEPH